MTDIVQIGTPTQIGRLISACATLGFVGGVELLLTVRRGEINLVVPARGAAMPWRVLEQSLCPLVCVVGDDDYATIGPVAWPATRRIFRWVRGALIHASGANVPSYQMAIGVALACRRLLPIGTDTAHMREWGETLLARKIPVACLQPTDGVHPVLPPKNAVQ